MNDDKNFDKRNELNAELAQLMSNLSANTSPIGDWKVIKIYEARLNGEEDPYDYAELAEARQAARMRINAIQDELKNLDKSCNFNETELAIINKSDDYLKNALDQLALAMLCISNIHNPSECADNQDSELIK